MPDFGIDSPSLLELRRKIRQLKDKELADTLKTLHKDLAEQVVQLASPNVPVRTGALKASLRGAGTQASAIGRVGSASVPYAAAVHWKYGPPFLTDAAARIEQDVVDRYDAAVAELLNRVIGD